MDLVLPVVNWQAARLRTARLQRGHRHRIEDGGEAVRDYGLDLVPWPRETTPAMTSTPTARVNILDVVMHKPELLKSSTNS